MQEFWGWLTANASLVSNLASLAMLLVWMFYAVLFYREFKQQRSPFIVIHQAKGYGMESTCLVVNLSRQPIHILCVLVLLHTTQGTVAQRIRNFRRTSRSPDAPPDVQTLLKQGPLASGSFLVLGSFEEVLHVALDDALHDALSQSSEWDSSSGAPDLSELLAELQQIEVRVIALHGAHSRPIAATRTFGVTTEGGEASVFPDTMLTRQLSNRRGSRTAERWLQECVPRRFNRLK